MAATDEKPTRLDKAKEDARRRIEALDASDQAMLIAFNSEAQILQSYTNRKDDLLAALDLITQTHRPTSFDQALALAEGQANPRRSAEEGATEQPTAGSGTMARASGGTPEGVATDVYIYSDGRFPDVPEFSLGKLHLHLLPIGHGGNNVGIIGLNLRRDDDKPDVFELSVRVLNFAEQAAQVSVQLEVFTAAGRQDRQLKPLRLPACLREEQDASDGRKKLSETPGGLGDITAFNFKDPGHGWLRVSLRDGASGQPWHDDFALDDVAWLAIAPVRRARVLRIGPTNDILDAFLQAAVAQQRAIVTPLAADDFETRKEYKEAVQAEVFDLVIFDRCAPASMEEMPQANTFFIGQVPPLRSGLQDTPPMKDLYIKEFQHTHSLFRGVETLQGLTIAEARKLPKEALPGRASPLMETQQEPVMWVLGRNRFTDLVQTFPLVLGGLWNTNWPKQPPGTLPLFLDNVLVQLGKYKEYEDPQRPGIPKVIEPGVPVEAVTVARQEPAGGTPEEIKRQASRELVYGSPEQVGLYEARWGQPEPFRFAVNLLDSNESNIKPREVFQVGEDEVKTTQEPVKQRQELWFWFALAALVILLIEWYVYQRRIYI